MTALRVLVVDDEPELRASTAQGLELAGFEVHETGQGERALELVGFGFPGVVISDIRMPGIDGVTLMSRLHEIDRDIPVILITGHGDVALAVRAMRAGAWDFVEKPFSTTALADIAGRAMDYRRLVLENRVLRAVAGQADDLETRLIGRSGPMVDLRRRIRTIAPTEADVLVVGETGTGKDLVARALHDLSPRAGHPFIAIDCAALPAQLIESELFGHEAGAFPGALRARAGKFEHARGGTVLLDDIASMPMEMQGKLLRVIERRAITRLGSHDPVPLDLRFIASSRVPLDREAAEGRFRADLLYRLNVVTLHLPPLADRHEDVPLLFLKLLAEAAARHRLAPPDPPPPLVAEVAARDWPGNVRELRNAADRYVMGLGLDGPGPERPAPQRLAERVAEFERHAIESALAAHGGALKPVYESLGLSRKTLWEKMQKHGIDKAEFGTEPDEA